MASPLENAALSAASYKGPDGAVDAVPPPPGWSWIGQSTSAGGAQGSGNGYFGVAYQNEATGEIVVVNRGSRVNIEGFKQDWIGSVALEAGSVAFQPGSDALIALQSPQHIPKAFDDAEQFARRIQKENPTSPVNFTGHSLGGAEAQIQAARLDKGSKATTFAAPGVQFGARENEVAAAQDHVVNFVLPGDPVTMCGDHIGKVVRLIPSRGTRLRHMSAAVLGALIGGGPLGALAAVMSIVATHMLGNYVSALEAAGGAGAGASVMSPPAGGGGGGSGGSGGGGGGRPAARLLDPTMHGPPLTPGTGSPNVLIGGKPAWRGLPAAAAAALQSAQAASDATIKAAEQATQVAQVAAAAQAGSPTGPAAAAAAAAAYAAEQAAKTAAAAALGSMMSGMKAAAATPSGGMPDTHICPIPSPLPPHGPGMVIDGSQTVLVNGLPLCRQSDTVLEALGGPDKIAVGEFTVLVGG